MDVLVVIDPLDSLNLTTETSLLLIEEMARRGHRCAVATLGDLYLTEHGAGVRAQPIALDLGQRPYYRLGAASECEFEAFDLVLFRKDPPVDEAYVTATLILDRAAAVVPVVNDPASLRTVNEKLLALEVPEFTPPTLVSNDPDRLAAFAAQHERIVVKPLTDCSGRGIAVVAAGEAPATLRAFVSAQQGRYVVAQRFLPGVAAGDKRIFLLDGEAIGAVNRVPLGPDRLANIHQGARVAATTITPRERAIVAALRPILRARRLWLAGIDVIDGWLTEVNVTSPSAARQINAVSGSRIEVPIVDFLERLAGAPRGKRTG
ncbi:glutathione synthase [Candidatus Binatia bacterium]|nr:glutathione synthase [Candidatus Binatia bacterium]